MWNEGFRIGRRGDPFLLPNDEVYEDDIAERACLKGHKKEHTVRQEQQ